MYTYHPLSLKPGGDTLEFRYFDGTKKFSHNIKFVKNYIESIDCSKVVCIIRDDVVIWQNEDIYEKKTSSEALVFNNLVDPQCVYIIKSSHKDPEQLYNIIVEDPYGTDTFIGRTKQHIYDHYHITL